MTVPVIERARSMPWLMDLRVHGERVADIVERTPRFRFEGEGALSQRRIVPETQAARDALAGASGPRVEQALRGLLATFDAQSGVTNLESISFSVDGRSAAVGHALGNLSWPSMDDSGTFVPTPRPDANARDRRRLDAALERMAIDLDEAHEQGANWGVSYRSINVAQATTDTFFDAVRAADRGEGDLRLDEVTHVLVHELAHRMTEPPLDGAGSDQADPSNAARWSRLQLLSEGSADLITHLPGLKSEARARMGLASVDEEPFQSGYGMFVDTLSALLAEAGLDTSRPEHREQVIEVLERPEMEDVPEAIASLVVQHRGIEWRRAGDVAKAIEHIGNHGLFPQDEESAADVRLELERRTAEAKTLIDQLAREASVRRERA